MACQILGRTRANAFASQVVLAHRWRLELQVEIQAQRTAALKRAFDRSRIGSRRVGRCGRPDKVTWGIDREGGLDINERRGVGDDERTVIRSSELQRIWRCAAATSWAARGKHQ